METEIPIPRVRLPDRATKWAAEETTDHHCTILGCETTENLSDYSVVSCERTGTKRRIRTVQQEQTALQDRSSSPLLTPKHIDNWQDLSSLSSTEASPSLPDRAAKAPLVG